MDKLRIPFAITLISIITVLVFFPVLNNDFSNWDDPDYVIENEAIHSLSAGNIQNIFTSFRFNAYQPLALLSLAIDYHFYGLSPVGYHLTNMFLHLLNALLVFWLIYLLSASVPLSLITACLFAVHPLSVESVAWVSERKGLLAAFFLLGAVISYIYYLRKERRLTYYSACLVLFTFSLLSKPIAATLPLFLLCLDYYHRRAKDKTMLFDKIPLFIVSYIFVMTAVVANASSYAAREAGSFSLPRQIAIFAVSIGFYLKKLLLPFKLCALYPHPARLDNFLSPAFLSYLAAFAALVIAAVYSRRYTKKIALGAAFFLLMIIPCIQIVPVGPALVSDRYAYTPSIGIFFIAAAAWAGLYARKQQAKRLFRLILAVVLVAGACAYSVLTIRRILAWQDGFTLWSDAIDNCPSSWAYFNRGYYFYRQGRFDEAVVDLDMAIRLEPALGPAYHDRGIVYLKKKDYQHAVTDLSTAIQFDVMPQYTYFNRGIAYSYLNEFEQAIADFTRSIQISPNDKKAYYYRAKAYFEAGRYAECSEDLDKAKGLGVDIEPQFLERVTRALAATNGKETAE